MQIKKNLIRRMSVRVLILAVTALIMSFSAGAQGVNISLPIREISSREVFDAIQRQTDYTVAVNKSRFSNGLNVRINRSPVSLDELLKELLSGSGFTYAVRGDHILIYENAAGNIIRSVSGMVLDRYGRALANTRVEVLDEVGASVRTYTDGRFRLDNVPAGNRIFLLTSPDGVVRYREVAVSASGSTDVVLTFDEAAIPQQVQNNYNDVSFDLAKTNSYFRPRPAHDNVVRATGSEAKSRYSLIPTDDINNDYLPKFVMKTNLLVWGTATANLALEFGLGQRTSLDLATGYNPFRLQKGGINKVGFVQPEFRYWFCNRFEKGYLGLHGIYLGYNIGQVDFLTRTFENHRYKGWGAGAGISYGYHVPMGKRWGWEFTVGAGYVYLEYEKFRCYDCDEFIGKKGRHYFGPTKAGISLIYMIK